jgi:exosortase
VIAAVGVATGFIVLFWGVLVRLVKDWRTDANYSHGFLIVPVALYFVWERRRRLRDTPTEPHWAGLAIIVLSIVLLGAGVLGAELFTTRVAMLGALLGTIVFLAGWPHARILMFPLLFLLLMIPIPSIIFNQIAFPLQLLASRVGELTLSALSIPVLREGNVIVLAHTSLEVEEACSGIRSLISLLTLGILFGYFTDRRFVVRCAIALLTVPVAIAANGLRIAGTGVAAHLYGGPAALGFFHTFSGWVVFAGSFGMLVALMRLLLWVTPAHLAAQPALKRT